MHSIFVAPQNSVAKLSSIWIWDGGWFCAAAADQQIFLQTLSRSQGLRFKRVRSPPLTAKKDAMQLYSYGIPPRYVSSRACRFLMILGRIQIFKNWPCIGRNGLPMNDPLTNGNGPSQAKREIIVHHHSTQIGWWGVVLYQKVRYGKYVSGLVTSCM